MHPPRNFENSQRLSNFEQMTSPEVINSSGNEATILVRIPFLFAYAEILASLPQNPRLPGSGRLAEWAVTGGLGPSGLNRIVIH